ncbi:cell division protein FtsZ [Patescibacteria group bacterium]|nr:cell division protein FtsZ [Patescibacteria group bacterium]
MKRKKNKNKKSHHKHHAVKIAKKPTHQILASIKVVGIGGGGGNAISRMGKHFGRSVDFVAVNTDSQDLDLTEARGKIYIGRNLTRGLGTGMNPELGRQAAEENRSDIAESLKGADIVFVAAGLGGGTGTGASPVIAEVAKQAGALTLGFVTKPFSFEGSQRMRVAQEGLLKLKEKVDALIIIPNDRIFSIINKETPLIKAFEKIDDVMENALKGIVDLIVMPGIINVDFADVKAILQDAGSAIVGLGTASGQDRAVKAINQALHSPLLEMSAEGAKGILLGIAGGKDLKMSEVNEAAKLVAQIADPSAKIIFGAYHDKSIKPGTVKATVIAIGFSGASQTNSLFSSFDSAPLIKEEGIIIGRQENAQKPDLESKKETKNDRKNPVPSEENDFWEIPAFLRKRKR